MCMCACVHVCMCVCTCAHVCARACMPVYLPVHVCVCFVHMALARAHVCCASLHSTICSTPRRCTQHCRQHCVALHSTVCSTALQHTGTVSGARRAWDCRVPCWFPADDCAGSALHQQKQTSLRQGNDCSLGRPVHQV